MLHDNGYESRSSAIADNARRGFRWLSSNEDPYDEQVTVAFHHGHESDMAAEFQIALSFAELRSLEKDDWLLFKKWQSEMMPGIFPQADITVIRHPAKYTDSSDLRRIESETGVTVPVEYLPK
ncbi:MAG: hypothetical protein AB8F65_10795 [Woeseiaceae bacterium]